MKAIRFHGIGDVRCEDMKIPEIEADEALVKILYAGICGSDLHIFRKAMFVENIPEIMGHEFVGQIVSIGDAVENAAVGDYVVGNPMVTCGECAGCISGSPNTCSNLGFIGEVRPGCFAEYTALPADSLHKVPDTADMKQTALVEPLAVALNICERAELKPEDKVAVIGSGPIGLLTILVAKKIYGVSSVTAANRSSERLALAEKAGADAVCNELAEGTYFNKVIETAGNSASLSQALEHTLPNGTLCVVSVFEDMSSVDMNIVVGSQIKLMGCNCYEDSHIDEGITLIAEGRLKVDFLITMIAEPEQCKEAFEALSGKDKKMAKILFRMQA